MSGKEERSGNEVLRFIERFLSFHTKGDDGARETLRKTFRAGYCYYFALMLQEAFERGTVCWAAPFGHIVWQDTDGACYDVEGAYTGEAYWFIPIGYLKEANVLSDFTHTENEVGASADTLIDIMQRYCRDNGIRYDSSVEGALNLN